MFSSHNHLYEHKVLKYYDEDEQQRDMHFIVSGGGGSPLHRATPETRIVAYEEIYRADGIDVSFITQSPIYHYCTVKTTSSEVSINVIEVTGEPENPVRVVETFVIRAR